MNIFLIFQFLLENIVHVIDMQHTKRTLMQFAHSLGQISVQSNLGIFFLLTYTTVSIDSVTGQQRPRSACI